MSTLGIDIGTSGCKALAVSADGVILAQAFRDYSVRRPQPGWAELDSEDVVRHCLEVIREVAAKVTADPIQSVAISSQGEAFTPVDARGRALAGAMVSSDVRANAIARSWPAQFGVDSLYGITGHTAHPLFSLFKLLWLREHEPHLWDRARRFLCFEDLLHLRLGLEPAIGWSLAGRTLLFDVSRHVWSAEILHSIGLEADRLAIPLPAGTPVGRVSPSVAVELGLGPEVVVVAGGHDQVCAALGAGAATPGVAMYASGTVECIAATLPHAVFSSTLRTANLCTYDHALPGRYATLAYSLTGGNLLAWFRDQWSRAEVAEAQAAGESTYHRILRDLPAEPTDLLVLPYFTASGTPYFDADTPGTIVGLRLGTRREQVLRALLEGVAFEMRLNLELLSEAGIPVRSLRAVGGGARDNAWLQLKSDVMARVIERVEVTEAGCLGAAALARAAVAGERVEDIVARWTTCSARFEPDFGRTAHYAGQFERYRRLYPVLRDFTRGQTP